MSKTSPYKRILLKLSGEALKGEEHSIAPPIVLEVAKQVKQAVQRDIEIALVIGGGNIFRGLSASHEGMDRTTADYMGMLGTTINALALQDALESIGVQTRVQTAISMRQIAEPYIRRKAIRHLSRGRVVIFAAGTGSPYFSTDTTAALRANEINADVILKATKVDGIYNKDPLKHSNAIRYEKISYIDALKARIEVMDSTAFSLCMDNSIPIVVFDFFAKNSFKKIINGQEHIGTLVSS